SVYPSLSLFVFSWSRDHRVLHSFPTRRSSDLHPFPPAGLVVGPVAGAVGIAREGLLHQNRVGAVVVELPVRLVGDGDGPQSPPADRKSTRLNSSHVKISYAVFCLKKKKKNIH